MDIFAPSDEESPSLVEHVSIVPTTETIEEVMNRLCTQKIQEYYKGKLINAHDQFVKLELKPERLKNSTRKTYDCHIS